jgi:hypothetical protein
MEIVGVFQKDSDEFTASFLSFLPAKGWKL